MEPLVLFYSLEDVLVVSVVSINYAENLDLQLEQPVHHDEHPPQSFLGRLRLAREYGDHSGKNDPEDAVEDVAEDERPSATDAVNEHRRAELGYDS